MKIIVYKFPKKRFEERYGKGTQGHVPDYKKGKRKFVIQIRKDLAKGRTKKIIQHEIGHILTERAKIHKKIDEKKKIERFAREQYYGEHSKKYRKKSEDIYEGLAGIYEKLQTGTATEKKILKKMFPKTIKRLRLAKKRIKPKVIIRELTRRDFKAK